MKDAALKKKKKTSTEFKFGINVIKTENTLRNTVKALQ